MERFMIIYTFHHNGNLNIFAKLDLKGFICTLGDGKMAVISTIIVLLSNILWSCIIYFTQISIKRVAGTWGEEIYDNKETQGVF